jgi:hypothetical protein
MGKFTISMAMFHVAIYVCLPGRVSKAGQSCDFLANAEKTWSVESSLA